MSDLNSRVEQGREIALAHLEQVGKKIFDGTYDRVETRCPCGADDDLVMTELDRTHLPHRVVVCKQCALMRANPMLTAAAYEDFYNTDYRLIYTGPSGRDIDDIHKIEYSQGQKLIDLLDSFDLEAPKVVVDWGCYAGGALSAFKEKGAETWGVEIDVNARIYAGDKGHNMVANLDELIAEGAKADLVIMQDVIEHLTDLKELQKLQHVLKPDGHLYVWTPGFFRSDLTWYFQLAHTYQFCARSLEYHMNLLGFQEVYTDEDIVSFWQWAGPEKLVSLNKPTEWVEYITDHWFRPNEPRKMPRFRGTCKFPQKLLYKNIEANLAQRVPDLVALSAKYQGNVAIIGGGPSIDDQVDTIKALNCPVIAIARMLPWCLDHGITPDFVASLDCSQEQEVCFQGELPTSTKYLLASVTRPSIFDMLKDRERYIFDTRESLKMYKLRRENGYTTCSVVSSVGSVAILCLSLAMNLGFRKLHVFGLDLMVANPEHTHAKGIAGPSLPQGCINVEVGGENVLTTASFIDFANQTLDLISLAHEDGILESIKFYGDSLVNRMWDGQWYADEAEVAA